MRGIARDRLFLGIAGAGFLLLSALLLWTAGFALVQGTDCAGKRLPDQVVGLDTSRSLWPPGAQCADGSVAQVFDGVTAVIVALLAAAVAVLVTGAVAAVRLRQPRDQLGRRRRIWT
jgi:hypothetical protein